MESTLYANCRMRFPIATLFCIVFASCGAQTQDFDQMVDELLDHSVPEVTYDSIDLKTVITVDAREYEEYSISHIGGAQWVGYNDFSMERVINIDKRTPIVVYCSVGYRSEKIAEKLIAEGYQTVYNLKGGVFEFVNSGQPVFSNSGLQTDSIHGYDASWGKWLEQGIKVY